MESYHRRIEYTFEEKQTIIQEIIKRQAYNGLRGNAFWQEFAARKILQRTWQSLKEHFRKQIIDVIHTFEISDKQKHLIKEGWKNSRVIKEDRNGKNYKRPRYNALGDEDIGKFKDKSKKDIVVDNESDSSSTSCLSTNFSRKRNRKLKNKNDNKQRRSPSEFNVFSDDEDNIPTRQNIIDDESPQSCADLLNNRGDVPLHMKANVENTCKYLQASNSKHVEPSTSGLHLQKKNESIESIVIDSDSDITTIVDPNTEVGKLQKMKSVISTKDTSRSGIIEEACNNSIVEEMSLEEDLLLINFIRSDKTYLKRREKIDIYNHFHEIYQDSKSPKQLKNRFLNHIFPNICEYKNLTHDEIMNFYNDAGVDIPDNLKSLTQELYNTMNKGNTGKQKDFQMNICEHELSRKAMNCIYCPIILKDQLHIFISDIKEKSEKEKLFEILSKKFQIDQEYIHCTDFVSHFLLEQVNKFRNSIYAQYENIITQSVKDNCKNIDLQQVICDLEVCVQAFPSDEDSSSENSDEDESSSIISQENINTQEFNPPENSTPQRKESQIDNEENASLNQEIEQENMSLGQSFEVENVSAVSNECDLLEIKDEPCSESTIIADISKHISYSHENTEISREDNKVTDSQYLESVSTQEITKIRNTVEEMANEGINVNNSVEIPATSETFYTAPGFSQDL